MPNKQQGNPEERPKCCDRPMNKAGKSCGKQRWVCVVNKGKGHSMIEGGRKVGGQCKGDEPKTGKERTRKWREKFMTITTKQVDSVLLDYGYGLIKQESDPDKVCWSVYSHPSGAIVTVEESFAFSCLAGLANSVSFSASLQGASTDLAKLYESLPIAGGWAYQDGEKWDLKMSLQQMNVDGLKLVLDSILPYTTAPSETLKAWNPLCGAFLLVRELLNTIPLPPN
jgi:hypothetical protein